MNRSDLRKYIRGILLNESRHDDISSDESDEFEYSDEYEQMGQSGQFYDRDFGPLDNLMADISDLIDNLVGRVDPNVSDDPLTKKQILEFVADTLREESRI